TSPPRTSGWYILAVLLMILSLLAKAWAMIIPGVLIILDAWPLRQVSKVGWSRILVEKLPFLVPAAVAAVLADKAQSSAAGTMASFESYGITQQVAQAFYDLAFYPLRTVLPIGLSPIYEFPHPFTPLSVRFIGAACGVVLATTALIALRQRWPAALV